MLLQLEARASVSAASGCGIHSHELRRFREGEAVPVDEPDDLLVRWMELADRRTDLFRLTIVFLDHTAVEKARELLVQCMTALPGSTTLGERSARDAEHPHPSLSWIRRNRFSLPPEDRKRFAKKICCVLVARDATDEIVEDRICFVSD